MREIEFRGKDNGGEWVYGSLGYDMHNSKYGEDKKVYFIRDSGGSSIVDADTIGQFTGVKDFQGTKVYEGDMFYCEARHPYFFGIVEWVRYGFRLKHLDECNRRSYSIKNSWLDKIEIVTNRHDNPELLNNENIKEI